MVTMYSQRRFLQIRFSHKLDLSASTWAQHATKLGYWYVYSYIYRYTPAKYWTIEAGLYQSLSKRLWNVNCTWLQSIHVYVYIYAHTHTHTQTDRQTEGRSNYNLVMLRLNGWPNYFDTALPPYKLINLEYPQSDNMYVWTRKACRLVGLVSVVS